MKKRTVFLLVPAVCMSMACGAYDARAADINGVWVSDAAVCQKVFEKKGNRVSFVKGSDIYGSGFIIDGNQIRGRIAMCDITARREQGPVVNIIAVCSTDIAIDTMQFRLRVEGPNKVVREFPGMPDLEMNYERCSI
jgi:hypothetical protein